MTLIDSMRKRVSFLEHTRAHLEGGWSVLWGRAESLCGEDQHRGRYGVAFERAVAPIEKSARFVVPFLSTGGIAVFMKGSGVDSQKTRGVIDRLGAVVEATITYTVPNSSGKPRTLVVVRRITDVE